MAGPYQKHDLETVGHINYKFRLQAKSLPNVLTQILPNSVGDETLQCKQKWNYKRFRFYSDSCSYSIAKIRDKSDAR